MRSGHLLSTLAVAVVLVLGCAPDAVEEAPGPEYNCSTPYSFPADLTEQSQVGADSFAWNSFLAASAGPGGPAWKNWSSTVDMIECGQATVPAVCNETSYAGTGRYYPDECVNNAKNLDGSPLPAGEYLNYSVIDQVGKIDDGFQEATTQGLSSDPVIDSNGNFLRYQIVISPGTQAWITSAGGGLQQESNLLNPTNLPVNFPCGAGEPDSYSQAMSVKLAWMELPNPPDTPANYYSQPTLVYNPGYRNSTGTPSCELKTLGLVGMHLVRKTTSQPAWVWATFEHNRNAPNCTAEPDSGTTSAGGGSTNTSCPSTVPASYSFYPQDCGSDGSACANCNTGYAPGTANALAENGIAYAQGMKLPQPGVCVNPDNARTYEANYAAWLAYEAWVNGGQKGPEPQPVVKSEPTLPASWCVDQAPAPEYGTSKLCRQVQPAGYGYTGDTFADTEPNTACRPASSPWSNYDLISTQWTTGLPSDCSTNVQDLVFSNTAGTLIQPTDIHPHTPVTGKDASSPTGLSQRSFMANTSMESYERSNCLGCHSKSTVVEKQGTVDASGTDFVYFLGVEVSAAASP